ncbi:Transglutaminase-like superfamily protein [compost metagenome]
MRKFIIFVIAAIILMPWISGTQAAHAAVSSRWLDLANIDKGAVRIQYDVNPDLKTKLLIVKGKEQYTYNLIAGSKDNAFSLQLGNGDYTISLLEQTNGNKYRLVHKETVKLDLADSSVVFLNSIQNVSWNDSNKAVLKAKELTQNKTTDVDKVKAIYDYVINNIKYDHQLAVQSPTDYIPRIDRTLDTKKDICYGYSTLFAAMLRSVDIPAKLVMGNTDYVSTYHAWNEVYLDGSWVIIDTTVDSGWNGTTTAFEMIKEDSKYSPSRQY